MFKSQAALIKKQIKRIGGNKCKGDRVHKDQVLVELESDELMAAVDEAAAAVGKARADIAVFASSVESAQAEVAGVEARIQVAVAEIEKAAANLEEAEIEMKRAELLFHQDIVPRSPMCSANDPGRPPYLAGSSCPIITGRKFGNDRDR